MRWGPYGARPVLAVALCACVALGATAGAGQARAQEDGVTTKPVPVDGKDPRDGTQLTGFRIQSSDGKAFLYFLCDVGEENPRLWFSHGQEIGASTKPFKIAYSIDGEALQTHWFYVLPNLKSGAFFPRHNQMYEERFGETPEMFDKEAGSVSQAYVDWYNNIYNSIIADFGFGGEAALFKIWDTSDQTYSYLFNLIAVRDYMVRLKSCYEPPRGPQTGS